MATEAVTLAIPEGTFPGMEMEVEWGGQSYSIAVPNSVGPGDEITVDLPALNDQPPDASSSSSSGTTPVTLVIPEATFSGMEMAVEWGGTSYSIAVPDGVGPGQEITVELPSLAADAPAQASLRDPTPPLRRVRRTATTPQELVGRRAELVGLVAKATLNGRKGVVIEWHADRGRLGVRIDGMQPDVAVKMENLKELPEDDVAPDNEEPPEAPPAGLYFCGDRVMVERSDGTQSECTIVEFDDVFETYTVNIGGAVCKYGVEESYITPIADMSHPAGDFYVGRRVRVPHLGVITEREEDKNGEVRAYDDASASYTLAMDSGAVARSIRRDEIKVLFQLRG